MQARAWSSTRLARSSSSSVDARSPPQTTFSFTATIRIPGNGIRQAATSLTAAARVRRRMPAASTALCSRSPRARRCSSGAPSLDTASTAGTMGTASIARLATPGNGIPPRASGANLCPPQPPVPDTTRPWCGTASATALSCSAAWKSRRPVWSPSPSRTSGSGIQPTRAGPTARPRDPSRARATATAWRTTPAAA